MGTEHYIITKREGTKEGPNVTRRHKCSRGQGARKSCSSSSPWPVELADILGGKLTKQQATACGAWPGFVGNGERN